MRSKFVWILFKGPVWGAEGQILKSHGERKVAQITGLGHPIRGAAVDNVTDRYLRIHAN